MSKIVCVADAYDAMTSKRPYRKDPLSQQEAINQLIANKDKQFDSKIVNLFIEWLQENK